MRFSSKQPEDVRSYVYTPMSIIWIRQPDTDTLDKADLIYIRRQYQSWTLSILPRYLLPAQWPSIVL